MRLRRGLSTRVRAVLQWGAAVVRLIAELRNPGRLFAVMADYFTMERGLCDMSSGRCTILELLESTTVQGGRSTGDLGTMCRLAKLLAQMCHRKRLCLRLSVLIFWWGRRAGLNPRIRILAPGTRSERDAVLARGHPAFHCYVELPHVGAEPGLSEAEDGGGPVLFSYPDPETERADSEGAAGNSENAPLTPVNYHAFSRAWKPVSLRSGQSCPAERST